MYSIEVVLVILLAVVASGYLVRMVPFSVPLPLVQIALGALIAAGFNAGVSLSPEVFFLLFVPPLLFLDGWRIPKDGLLRDSRVILQLALGLVVFTVLGAGLFIHWLIPAIPLPVAFALAAIVSPTDPVAVSSITARTRMPERLTHILEGESLLNDASGLVCFRFAVAAAMTGSFSLASASFNFLWVALAGLALGTVTALAACLLQHWLYDRVHEETGTPILLNLMLPFGAYLLSEQIFHASGILAAVAAGITISYWELRGNASAATRVQGTAVWDTVQFALNGTIFVLLGEQLPGIFRQAAASVAQSGHTSSWWLVLYAIAITLVLVLMRLAWVWVSLRLTTHRAHHHGETARPHDWRLVMATALAGPKGTITLAGVMTLPLVTAAGVPFPARDLVIFLAAAVILLSLILANIGLPPLLKDLELPLSFSEDPEEYQARRQALLAGIAAIEKAQAARGTDAAGSGTEDAETFINASAHVMALYRRRLGDGDGDIDQAEQRRRVNEAERAVHLIALRAERDAIFAQARKSTISDATARKLVRELDLMEARQR